MRIIEFQSKKLCGANSIPIPKNKLIINSNAIQASISELHFPIVLKSQVNAIHREKFGGICLARDFVEAEEMITSMFTGQIEHQPVTKILAEELIEFEESYSISLAFDQTSCHYVLTGWKVTLTNESEKKRKYENSDYFQSVVDPVFGIKKSTIGELAISLGIEKQNIGKFTSIMFGLWHLFIKYDAQLIELNPLVIDKNQSFFLLGVQFEVDNSALFRQPEICDLIQDADLQMKNEFWRIGCDYFNQPGEVWIIGNDLDHCFSIQDVLLEDDVSVGPLIGIEEKVTAKRIETVLDLILTKYSAKVVFMNNFDSPNEYDQVISGIHDILKSHKESKLVVRLNGRQLSGLYNDKRIDNLIIANTIEEALVSIASIKKAGS